MRFCSTRLVLAALWMSVIAVPGWVAAQSPAVATQSPAAQSPRLPTISESVTGLQCHGGFFDVYWDDSQGKLLLEVDRWGDDFLVLDSLATGLGSNPVGLDRGQLGRERLCRWKRVGRRVFLEQQNTRFRAIDAPAVERRAVRDSFAPSIIWGGDVVAIDGTGDAVLVDITDWVESDRHEVSQTLKNADQGSYSVDARRSSVRPAAIKSFPDNVELEAWLTFVSGEAGPQVRSVAANGKAFTIRQRISLIRLPDDDFIPREFHPRVGSFSIGFADYAAPLDQSMHRSLMTRHRFSASEPIIYYVDPAAPEPVRSALVDGASWWREAFAKAGFPNGYEVRVAPVDMDPLDVRYNYIQWVHRQTRGWSYGASVVDPRTGEILKGHVSLGSLRVRQDRLLIDNLAADAVASKTLTGVGDGHKRNACGVTGCACGMAAADHGIDAMIPGGMDRSTQVALARIRQLAAHEVGHTLGLAHNFAASTYGNRASVMDYPAPRIQIDKQGQLDFSDAYGIGVGEWDHFCIRAMYAPLGEDADATMNQWVRDAMGKGWIYSSDSDARPASASDPRGNLWDDGTDAVDGLRHAMRVRQIGLAGFDFSVLLPGETAGDLRRYFAPLYFHHRYQVDAAVKVIGGVQYAYGLGGDDDSEIHDVPVDQQRQAMRALLETLDPAALIVDPAVLKKLVPAGSAAAAWSVELPGGRTD
ncbi:MAG: zinc-dependent metalloprotease, partial [Planctomycetota bacterium]